MTLNERLLNIKNTWQVIKAKDTQLLAAGATTHQYNLNTTLTNETIQTF